MNSELNKYEKLFASAASTNDVRTIFFSNCDGLSESDFASLKEAHDAAFDRLSRTEFEAMWQLVGVK